MSLPGENKPFINNTDKEEQRHMDTAELQGGQVQEWEEGGAQWPKRFDHEHDEKDVWGGRWDHEEDDSGGVDQVQG